MSGTAGNEPDGNEPALGPATIILNVDDSEVARYTKNRTLRHAGFQVSDAADGTRAMELLEALQPALAVLDVKLPDMSGIDLCKHIKRRWPSTLVLQTSATFVGASDRARGLEGGADAYLVQPIDPDELVAAVRALLRLHAAEEATRRLNATLEQRIKERTRELNETNQRLLEQIAQRERAEQALVQSQKMQAMGQLTGAMAHDFNNLLASMVGYIHVIRLKVQDAEVRALADRALAAVERGSKLTARLLAFARPESPMQQPVDVRRVVAGMEDWLRQSLGGLIHLELDVSDAPLVALTDLNQLELALLNIVLNARDAMADGGRLQLRVRREALAQASDELAAGEYICIEVHDSGEGMPPEVLRRAFDPFFTTKPVGRGTGLGLPQVYNLAKASGGGARIRSTPGEGTEVQLWLRASDRAEPAQAASATAPQARGRGEDVLLVDDEDDIRSSVSQMLTSNGYHVRVAESGVRALALLGEAVPQLLVLDFAMPGPNGIDVARLVRQRWPRLPILFLSGHANLEALEAAASGARLLRKPFGPAELFAAVRTSMESAVSL
jgi:DNA-binding response OmpR family regulator